MSIGKINLFLLKLLNLFLALHQKRRTTLPSFLLARTEKGRCDCIASSFFLKPTDLNDWRRSPADPPRSRPSGRRRRCAVQAFWPLAKTLAQAEFTSAEHCNRRRVKAAKPKSKTKSSCFLMVPIGTFSEPGELSGTEADGGNRPPLCFHASNRMIASFSVISLAMRGAWSPSRMGASSAPMSRYTIRTL